MAEISENQQKIELNDLKSLKDRFEFRAVRTEEIPEVIRIEQYCFPPHEACSPESMAERIAVASALFLVAEDRESGEIAGFLNGTATEETSFRDAFFTEAGLHDPEGRTVMLLGLDVRPEYREMGLARALVEEYARRELENGRSMLVLTCLEDKVHMYERMGFVDSGMADSSWGGESWHEMVLRLQEFRGMRRFRQALSRQECIEILRQEPRGVLSVLGEHGYPYGMPLDHWYCEENGRLYFHGSRRTGHRYDALMACDKVSYCVYDEGYRRKGEWALNIRSVIVFGRMRIVEDEARALEICRRLAEKYTDDESYITHELEHAGPRVQVLELVPEHMSGKLVNES